MKQEQIIRAWKDEDYRLSLSETELSALPENPAGLIELADDRLAEANGGTWPEVLVGISIGIASWYASCERCHETMGGGTCGMLTAGCC
jgi:mersacidin/lichenicidin family type 2 lantibiotic